MIAKWYEQPPLTGKQDLIVFRHAQSQFNKGFNDYRDSNNIHDLHWRECIKRSDFNELVSYAPQYIDCSLTQEGVKESHQMKEKLKDEKIDIILVSPYQRALQTCVHLFEDKSIPVQVHPLFAEAFRFSCDISCDLKKKKQRFSNFDFTHMEDLSDLWFVQILPKDQVQRCKQEFKKQDPQSYEEKQQIMLQLIKKGTIYQTPQQLRQRILMAKRLLLEYKKKYQKIAVISHYQLVVALIAEGYDEDGEVIKPPLIHNVDPIYVEIDKIVAIK